MSIANEIKRLQDAKTSIKTALENKGVEVGNETIDTYASKINNMSVLNSKIYNMSYLFAYDRFGDDFSTVLKLVEKPTRIDSAFSNCTKITKIDLSDIDMSECTLLSYAFSNCYNVTEIKFGKIESKKVTSAVTMLANCEELIDLDMSCFDFGKVTEIQSFSTYIYSLVNFKSFKNLGKAYTAKTKNYYAYGLGINSASKLTHESLMDIINNGLYDLNKTYNVANGGTLYTQQLQIGSTNIAKLTSAEIKKATDKGWSVS